MRLRYIAALDRDVPISVKPKFSVSEFGMMFKNKKYKANLFMLVNFVDI